MIQKPKPGLKLSSIERNASRGSKARMSISHQSRRASRATISTSKISTEAKTPGVKIPNVVADDGRDLTPKSLFSGPMHERASQMKLGDDNSSSADFRSLTSLFQTGIGTTQAGMSMFGISVLGSRNSLKSMQSQIMHSQVNDDEEIVPHFEKSTKNTFIHDIIPSSSKSAPTQSLNGDELEEDIAINVEETETITYFRIYGSAVTEETDNIEKVKEINDDYRRVIRDREISDKYMDRPVQTFNNALKHKESGTSPIGAVHKGCQVSTSRLYDAYNVPEGAVDPEPSGRASELQNESTKSTDALQSAGSISSVHSTTVSKRTQSEKLDTASRHAAIVESSELGNTLSLVERVISQNIAQGKLGAFRGVQPLDFDGNKLSTLSEDDQKLHQLWAFQSDHSKGYTAKAMAWNQVNPDIIAICYGYNDSDVEADKGLVCCWNIKNLEHPERVYHLPTSATSADFSLQSPNLLAVGGQNGVIFVFNVASKTAGIALDTTHSPGKHFGPVWSVKWVERERSNDERAEVLISCSADGRVVQWTIRKGFQSLDLMKVKRVEPRLKKNNKNKKEAEPRKTHAQISQFAPTTSFDFHPTDGNTYLIGTEEGLIHRCSCSYNEQTLDTYHGHAGPVYSVKWHSTLENVFLSCSEDWSIRLWHQKQYTPVMTLQSAQHPVNNVLWSPYTCTLFIAISDGTIDVWDLTHSILDPIMTVPMLSSAQLKTVGFAPNSNCIFVGDSDGTVSVYQVNGFHNESKKEDISALIEASIKLN